ncbi:MAG: ribulose-phosphate 3-epimerase [Nitrospinota bacterium]
MSRGDLKIAPSLLAADFSKLGEELVAVEKGGADLIHLDIMDGHFVPNISIGPKVVRDLKKIATIPFDVHLMIESPDDYIESFASSGADNITIHIEGAIHLNRTIELIRSFDKRVGVSINPHTPANLLLDILPEIDLVLIMTVNPGFSGQSLIESTLPKIAIIRNEIDKRGLKVAIEVDGGVGVGNASRIKELGADILVAGSAIFSTNSYQNTIQQLRTS